MEKYTGYGPLNAVLDKLENLKEAANLQANNLMEDDLKREVAQSQANVYAFTLVDLLRMGKPSFTTLAAYRDTLQQQEGQAAKAEKAAAILSDEMQARTKAARRAYAQCLALLEAALSDWNYKNKVGLFGSCGSSYWREPLKQQLAGAKVPFFDPVVLEWTPECAEEEANNLANNLVLVFAITDETFGVASLAEVGMAVAQVAASNETRHLVVWIADQVCEKLASKEPERAKDSNRARVLALAHLHKLALPNVHIVSSVKELADKALEVYVSAH